jgi:hypothetical protein
LQDFITQYASLAPLVAPLGLLAAMLSTLQGPSAVAPLGVTVAIHSFLASGNAVLVSSVMIAIVAFQRWVASSPLLMTRLPLFGGGRSFNSFEDVPRKKMKMTNKIERCAIEN